MRLRIDRFRFELGSQRLELSLAPLSVVGVSDADARSQLCAAMARALTGPDPSFGVVGSRDDERGFQKGRITVSGLTDRTPGELGAAAPQVLGRVVGSARADPQRLVVDTEDCWTPGSPRMEAITRLRRSHRLLEALTLLVAVALPVMAFLWADRFWPPLAILLVFLSVLPAFLWRYVGVRIETLQMRAVSSSIAERQQAVREPSGEAIPVIVDLARWPLTRRWKGRLVDALVDRSAEGQVLVVTDDVELVNMASGRGISVTEHARARPVG